MAERVAITPSGGYRFFLPSRRASLLIVALVLTALAAALFLRYGIIQNTPIGLACEAGEASLTCQVRIAVILVFIRDLFGWTALALALLNLVRPHPALFATGLAAASMGLVLYNTRLSALAVALLLLSLARAAPARP